jgi:hypothetical protein
MIPNTLHDRESLFFAISSVPTVLEEFLASDTYQHMHRREEEVCSFISKLRIAISRYFTFKSNILTFHFSLGKAT